MQPRTKEQFFLLVFLLLLYTTTLSQEYTYDTNGNLAIDGNKEISFIHYNHLHLVDTIIYADGRKIIYTYTAAGEKLRERTILGNGTVKQKRDYCGAILYRNDSLAEITHEAGRIVPAQPGNVSSPEYQYHLADHLGNVRSTVTSKQESSNHTASFESVNAYAEQSNFLRYQAVRKINSALFDHTRNGSTNYSERLNGSVSEKYGIARSLSVMPGDVIKLAVFAKYVDPNYTNWTQALTTLLTQIALGTAPAGTVVDGSSYATNGSSPFPFAGLNNTSESTGAGPKAYLNWLIFDRNFVFKTGGYVRVSAAAKENGANIAHERLFTEFTIREAGYVYVYLSNEETSPIDVYFDDMSVTQENGPVVQEADYDPFGLTFNEYARENTIANNFLYNGKELQRDFDLNWYDYGTRMYDVALGRWHVVDARAEKYTAHTPYNYALNNPVKFIDPDGNDVVYYKNDNTPSGNASPRQAVNYLNNTAEGRRILKEAENNKNTKVYVTFRMEEKFPSTGTIIGKGVTLKVDDTSLKTDKSTNKTSLNVADSRIDIFNNMDVTGDIKNGVKIFLVAVSFEKEAVEMAQTLAHELEAHVNIPQRDPQAVQLVSRLASAFGMDGSQSNAEHLLYGGSTGGIFVYGGKVIGSDSANGTTANKVEKQLGDLYRRLGSGNMPDK